MNRIDVASRTLRETKTKIILAWALAWVAGLSLLATLAIQLNSQLRDRELDGRLEVLATVVYGLTWFDGVGQFHDGALHEEAAFFPLDVEVWVVDPRNGPAVYLEPENPTTPLSGLLDAALQAMVLERTVVSSIAGTPQRILSIPTYLEDQDQVPHAAIVVTTDTVEVDRDKREFAMQLGLGVLALGVVGLAVGTWLAKYSLQPLAQALIQRERFLAAAAHELRNPMASILAVADSALAGDEEAPLALRRLRGLAGKTSETIEDLLLFARLEAGQVVLRTDSVRLDLLVEACLPDPFLGQFKAQEVVRRIDPGLMRIAIRNLLENATKHGVGGSDGNGVRVSVAGSTITVCDSGPGFPADVLSIAGKPFRGMPSRLGAGFGLATVSWIASLHHGQFKLSNLESGGAQVTFVLGDSSV